MAHIHIIGQTGNGSENLLQKLILDDISHTYKTISKTVHDRDVFVFDFHGNTIDFLLPRIPRKRIKDTVLFDPNFPIAWNPLQTDDEPAAVAASIVDTFRAINGYDISANLFQKSLYSAVLALIETGSTLFDVKYLFISETFRKRVVKDIKNPVIKRFWEIEYPQLSPREQNDLVRSAETTFHILISDIRVAKVLAQKQSLVPFSGVFLVRVPQGEFGIQRSSTIASLLLGQILSHAQRNPYKHLSIYLPDCHNLAPNTLIELLQSGAKYGVHITLAHQTLSQLDFRLKDAVLGCADRRHVFRVSMKDAEELASLAEHDNTNARLDELSSGKYRSYPFRKDRAEEPTPSLFTLPKEMTREKVLATNTKYHRAIDIERRMP